MCYCLNPACNSPQNTAKQKFCQACGATLALRDRYWALKPIGQGGFGKTFLATDALQPSHPRCVIKQFWPQQQGTDNLDYASELFRQEALRLKELGKHAQIPSLLDYLEQEGQQYLIQEFIDGQDLAQELAQNGAFIETQILALLDELLPVLKFIHEHQVIHRDVKPANIIRSSTDQKLFLVDLGAAKYATGTALVKTGTVIGSAEYTAPEQAKGKAVFASDIYSLGATCIHLLTEMSPFDLFDNANGCWVWREYLKQPLTNIHLGRMLDRMLQAATNQRYRSIQEVQIDLAAMRSPKTNFTVPSERDRPYPLAMEASNAAPIFQENRSVPHLSVASGGAITRGQSASITPPASRRLPETFHRFWKPIPRAGVLAAVVTLVTVGFLLEQSHKFFQPIDPVRTLSQARTPNSSFSQSIEPVRTLSQARAPNSEQHTVTSLAISPNGRILASGGFGIINLWDTQNGKLNQTLSAPTAWIGAVAISPDGKTLISTTDRGVIQLRHLPSGNLFRSLNDLTKAIAISPDGQLLASGSSGPDTSIKVWNLRSGALARILPGHYGTVSGVAFSPDGRTLASSSYDGTIRLWQLPDGKLIRTLNENPKAGPLIWVESVAISPDGQTLVASVGNTLKLWDLHSGALLRKLLSEQAAPSAFETRITVTAMSPKGDVIASGTARGALQLWDLHSGKLLRTVERHNTRINSIIFSADGKTLISGSDDGSIKFWLTKQLLTDPAG